MELNLLKIDLDIESEKQAKEQLKTRLSYLYDMKVIDIKLIEKVELLFKSSHSCLITFKKNLLSVEHIIIFQLILGSDWRKEANTLINHYSFGMEYSNRLFTTKWYDKDNYKNAKITNITNEVKGYIKNPNRKIHYN